MGNINVNEQSAKCETRDCNYDIRSRLRDLEDFSVVETFNLICSKE